MDVGDFGKFPLLRAESVRDKFEDLEPVLSDYYEEGKEEFTTGDVSATLSAEGKSVKSNDINYALGYLVHNGILGLEGSTVAVSGSQHNTFYMKPWTDELFDDARRYLDSRIKEERSKDLPRERQKKDFSNFDEFILDEF